MYYEKKSSFYIRQYGPSVAVIFLSIVLIAVGLFIAAKSLENDMQNNQVANLIEENPSVDISSTMPEKLSSLNAFSKSEEFAVYAITSDGGIIINTSKDEYYKINLIGIENSSYLKENMEKDLLNKNVVIEFDNSKIEKNKAYAYVYLNGILYNSEILKNGYSVLRVERKNVDKLDILLQAETQARNAKVGIWEA